MLIIKRNNVNLKLTLTFLLIFNYIDCKNSGFKNILFIVADDLGKL
jgi:hypothetical protein